MKTIHKDSANKPGLDTVTNHHDQDRDHANRFRVTQNWTGLAHMAPLSDTATMGKHSKCHFTTRFNAFACASVRSDEAGKQDMSTLNFEIDRSLLEFINTIRVANTRER